MAVVQDETPPFGDEGRSMTFMTEACRRMAPGRFALVQVLGEWVDARIAGYGLADDDEVTVTWWRPDGSTDVHGLSRAMFDEIVTRDDLRVVWLDRVGVG